jgi:hypothetical protein
MHLIETMGVEPDLTGVVYAAVVGTKRQIHRPGSRVAKLWNKLLGPRGIPFDPDARKTLIAQGSKNRELKRHIDAWKEMKRKA